jgi:hypothetical protein
MRPARLGVEGIVVLIAAMCPMSVEAKAQDVTRETIGALPQETPASTTGNSGDTAGPAVPTGTTGSGMILVSKRAIAVLAGPSSSASVLYGFPAGRSFRLIGREAGFAQIQDLKSSATGWIDETALAPSPVPASSVSSEPNQVPSDQTATAVSAEPKPNAQNPESRGIFGLGSNSGHGVLSGFLGGVFGNR